MKVLRSNVIFSETKASVLEQVVEALTEIQVEANEVIVRKGDPGNSMYVIAKGLVKVHNEDHVHSTLTDFQAFGEYALVENAARSATVTALETSILLRLGRVDFDRILSESLAVTKSILSNLIKRMIQMNMLEEELARSNRRVTLQQDQILDSIRYAKRIQDAMLPSDKTVKRLLPQSMLFFQPRDIVSGDFYWLAESDQGTLIAAADCTGHGVPGAFMSVIGYNLLEEIVNQRRVSDPGEILGLMHQGIVRALHQQEEAQAQDGMDLALCRIDQEAGKLYFAGAMNRLYVVDETGITVVKGNFRSVGGLLPGMKQNRLREFVTHELPLQAGVNYYLTTDGLLDQFGGVRDEKLNNARFQELLIDLYGQSFEQQQEQLKQFLNSWMGDLSQLDDILVIGFST